MLFFSFRRADKIIVGDKPPLKMERVMKQRKKIKSTITIYKNFDA